MLKVVILGAGSSQECGLPLGNKVLGWLDSYSDNDSPRRDFIANVFPQFVAGVSEYPTFEIILSWIYRHIKNKKNIGRYSSSDLVSIRDSLIISYREIFNDKCSHAIFEFENKQLMPDAEETRINFLWYQNFFKQLVGGDGDTIFISLNYDVLLDLTLSCMVESGEINDFTYGVDLYDLENQNEKCRESGVLLLKPHGSINLAQCPKCKKIFDGVLGINRAMIEENYSICRSCGSSLNILILPPTFSKSEACESYYADIHKKISEKISKADEILIIGYSLPDYDFNILEAFLKGAVENENRLKLDIKIVGNSDGGEMLKNKYGSIFNRTKGRITYHSGGFKKYAENSQKTELGNLK